LAIDVDDLEPVGITHEGNTPGIRDGLTVYQLRGAGTGEMYTFQPRRDLVNPEDGQTLSGQAGWTRWTP
jgi:hypothetical protein